MRTRCFPPKRRNIYFQICLFIRQTESWIGYNSLFSLQRFDILLFCCDHFESCMASAFTTMGQHEQHFSMLLPNMAQGVSQRIKPNSDLLFFTKPDQVNLAPKLVHSEKVIRAREWENPFLKAVLNLALNAVISHLLSLDHLWSSTFAHTLGYYSGMMFAGFYVCVKSCFQCRSQVGSQKSEPCHFQPLCIPCTKWKENLAASSFASLLCNSV